VDLAAPGTPVYSLAGPGGNRTEVTSVWLICDDVMKKVRDAFGIAKSAQELLQRYADSQDDKGRTYLNPVRSVGAAASPAKLLLLGKEYVLKTLDYNALTRADDLATLVQPSKPGKPESTLLHQFAEHMVRYSQDTRLTRFLMILILPTEKNGMQPWVLMNNAKGGMKMDREYDLKGSSIGRQWTEKKQDLKDLDWIKGKNALEIFGLQGGKIYLPPPAMRHFTISVARDVEWLAENNLMDYSLSLTHDTFAVKKCQPGLCAGSYYCAPWGDLCVDLNNEVGAHHSGQQSGAFERFVHAVKKLRQAEPCGAPVCMMSLVEPGEGPVQVHHYCLSVLDLLSEYNLAKFAESKWKGNVKHLFDDGQISVKHPDLHKARFVKEVIERSSSYAERVLPLIPGECVGFE
jgi:hypothetical protein